MKEINVKATPVNGLAEFVQSQLTSAELEKVLAQLPPEHADLFKGHLLASQEVPLSAVNLFTRLAAAEKGEPVKTFGRRAGIYGANQGLKTVYKFILMMMSIDFALKKAPLMWTRVYDAGSLDVAATGENTATIRVSDFPADEAGCARITGWFETIGEKSGAKNIKVVHACRTEGAPQCRWDFSWTK